MILVWTSFPLAYSFLSGTAPGPNPPAQLSGVPVYLPAPTGAPGTGPRKKQKNKNDQKKLELKFTSLNSIKSGMISIEVNPQLG